jgi:hypothetical protein
METPSLPDFPQESVDFNTTLALLKVIAGDSADDVLARFTALLASFRESEVEPSLSIVIPGQVSHQPHPTPQSQPISPVNEPPVFFQPSVVPTEVHVDHPAPPLRLARSAASSPTWPACADPPAFFRPVTPHVSPSRPLHPTVLAQPAGHASLFLPCRPPSYGAAEQRQMLISPHHARMAAQAAHVSMISPPPVPSQRPSSCPPGLGSLTAVGPFLAPLVFSQPPQLPQHPQPHVPQQRQVLRSPPPFRDMRSHEDGS